MYTEQLNEIEQDERYDAENLQQVNDVKMGTVTSESNLNMGFLVSFRSFLTLVFARIN